MKKIITLVLGITVLCFASGCGTKTPGRSDSSQEGMLEQTTNGGAADEGETDGLTEDNTSGKAEELAMLYDLQRGNRACVTEHGYYYFSGEVETLSDGQEARHLMYIDFDTKQEIYLCSNAACSHDTVDCTSVFLLDEFSFSACLFAWQDSLYILEKEPDQDGSVVMGAAGGESGAVIESKPAVLYRMNPDGTGREKMYEFQPNVTLEDVIAGDENGIYLITKKVISQTGDGNVYQVSSDRNLIYLDLSERKETVLCSMDFGDDIQWDMIGCFGRNLVLYGIDFGRPVTAEEKSNDDISIYDDSYDVFAVLNLDDLSLREGYRVFSPKSRGFELYQGTLYYSIQGEGKITGVNLLNGEETVLCEIQQDALWGIIGDRLYTRNEKDNTYYFIDVNTGTISHSGLVNHSLGWSLDIVAEAGDQVLVIYDYDATPQEDGSYIIHGYQYGLIDKEDLFTGNDKFIPIRMITPGGAEYYVRTDRDIKKI